MLSVYNVVIAHLAFVWSADPDADTNFPLKSATKWMTITPPGSCLTKQCVTQTTQNICITFIQCWTSVADVGPALYKCYTNVLCLLGTDIKWLAKAKWKTRQHTMILKSIHFANPLLAIEIFDRKTRLCTSSFRSSSENNSLLCLLSFNCFLWSFQYA